jgi:hypothetical protein
MSGDATDHSWYARRIPDDLQRRSGDARARLERIVRENWWPYDEESRARLIETLLPLLLELARSGASVTDEHRDHCERIVAQWLADQ